MTKSEELKWSATMYSKDVEEMSEWLRQKIKFLGRFNRECMWWGSSI